jgi:hypothetical protein
MAEWGIAVSRKDALRVNEAAHPLMWLSSSEYMRIPLPLDFIVATLLF